MNDLLEILLTIAPIILLGCYVYFKDDDKEPSKILFRLFIGGFLAAILTVLLSMILETVCPYLQLDNSSNSVIRLFLHTFIMVGLVEECSKWIFLYLFSYKSKEFDQLYDMIVYSVFVALGFALIENILYVNNGGISTAIIRFFLAIPAHVSMSIFMGYYLSLAKLSKLHNKNKKSKKYIILSIFIPSIFHGIYDYCILSNSLILLFIFLLFIIILFFKANQKLLLISKKNQRLN